MMRVLNVMYILYVLNVKMCVLNLMYLCLS